MSRNNGPEDANRRTTNVREVAKEWDQDIELRERLREGGSVLTPNPTAEDISTSVKNRGILDPILIRMSADPKRHVPGIDQLKDEVEQLLKTNKRALDADGVDIPKTSWAIRKLCGFIKAKARRREVSTVTGLHPKFPIVQAVYVVLYVNCHKVMRCTNHHGTSCGYGHLCFLDSQVKSFQQMVLLLDPMLQALTPYVHSIIVLLLVFMFNSHLCHTAFVNSLAFQAEVDAVNKKVAERLKKKGRKDWVTLKYISLKKNFNIFDWCFGVINLII